MTAIWRSERLPELVRALASRPRHEALRGHVTELLRSGFGAPHEEIGQEVYLLDGSGRIDTMWGATVILRPATVAREAVIAPSIGPHRGLVQGKEESNANEGRRCTQNTQMGPCGSKAMRHALDLQRLPAEIERQTEPQAGRFGVPVALGYQSLWGTSRFDVIEALHLVRVVQCFGGLQINQEHILDQQVLDVVAGNDVIVVTLAPNCWATDRPAASSSNAHAFS